MRFMAGEYDLLLSTTIVEAGLDIPNVNTIIHHADKFGLAQLYQLRAGLPLNKLPTATYLSKAKF